MLATDLQAGQLVRVRDFRNDTLHGRGAVTNARRHALIGRAMRIRDVVSRNWMSLPTALYARLLITDSPGQATGMSDLLWPPQWLEPVSPLAHLVKRYKEAEFVYGNR